MHQSGFTFGKSEKLCRRKLIDQLFGKGNSFLAFPLKVQFLFTELPEDVPAQVMFSVSKRRFKRAVKRNLLKRRMREAYRLNKHQLHECAQGKSLQMAIAFIYIGDSILDYHSIEKGMKKALIKLTDEIKRNDTIQSCD